MLSAYLGYLLCLLHGISEHLWRKDCPRGFRGDSRASPSQQVTFDCITIELITQITHVEKTCSSIGCPGTTTSDATSSRSCVLSRVSQEEAQVLTHVSMLKLRVAWARLSAARFHAMVSSSRRVRRLEIFVGMCCS